MTRLLRACLAALLVAGLAMVGGAAAAFDTHTVALVTHQSDHCRPCPDQ